MKHVVAYEGLSKVSLGLMQEEYIPLFVPWINRRTSIEGTLQRPPYSFAQGLDWLHALDKEKGKREVFAVLLHRGTKNRRTYRFIGHTGLHHITWPDGVGISGSIIGDLRGQRRGCGTEAKLLLLYHAFYVLGLRKVCAEVKGWNAQSLGHLIKCGYKIVGRQKEQLFHKGKFVDNLMLEVFRDEWEPIWERYRKMKKLPSLTRFQSAQVMKATIF